MNKFVLATIVSVAVGLPGAAFAQGTRSASDYVCELTGDECGDDQAAEEITKDAPDTKGFRLTKPGEAKAAAKAAPVQRPMAARPAPAARPNTATQPTRVATATPKRAPKASSAAKQAAARRSDLRLTFELGSATLTQEAQANAKAFAEALNRPALAGKKVLIEGHTDRQGSADFNLELSQRRAQAVADYLKTLGIAGDRLQVQGHGFAKPISSAPEKNRRVEAVLVS
jgi:outer membrane protein OmpA-like peptidoglycan-associated protein